MSIQNIVVQKSTKLPVNWTLLKQYLRDDFSQNNEEINNLIKSATAFVEKYIVGSLVKQTRVQILDNDDAKQNKVYLQYGPIIQINTITGIYPGGTQEVIDASTYSLNRETLYLNFPLIYDEIEIEYECGYDDIRSIPSGLIAAVMRVTANLYTMKEDVSSESINIFDQTEKILNEYKKIYLG